LTFLEQEIGREGFRKASGKQYLTVTGKGREKNEGKKGK